MVTVRAGYRQALTRRCESVVLQTRLERSIEHWMCPTLGHIFAQSCSWSRSWRGSGAFSRGHCSSWLSHVLVLGLPKEGRTRPWRRQTVDDGGSRCTGPCGQAITLIDRCMRLERTGERSKAKVKQTLKMLKRRVRDVLLCAPRAGTQTHFELFTFLRYSSDILLQISGLALLCRKSCSYTESARISALSPWRALAGCCS